MKAKSARKSEKEKIEQVSKKLGRGMASLYKQSLAVELYAQGQGVKKDEIAEVLGCKRDTINTYLRTAKQEKTKNADSKKKIKRRLLMVAKLYLEGESAEEIAEELVLDEKTVIDYINFLLAQEKLGPILEKRHKQEVEKRKKIERELDEEDEER